MQITRDTTLAFLAVTILALGALMAAAKTQAAVSPQVLSAYGIMRMPDGEYMMSDTGAGAGAGTQTEPTKSGSGGHMMPNGQYMEGSGGGHDAVPNDNTSYLQRMRAGNAQQQHLH